MAINKDFVVKNGLVVGGTLTANNSTGSSGQVLTSTGSGIYWASTPSGSTNLTYSANTSSVTIASDTGADAVILAANTSIAGLVSTAGQTFGGIKTFQNGIVTDTFSSLSTNTLSFKTSGTEKLNIDSTGYMLLTGSQFINSGGAPDGNAAFSSYAQKTATSNNSSIVTGAEILSNLYTGAFNSTGEVRGIYSMTQGAGLAGTNVATLTGISSYIAENGSGTVTNATGFDSTFYGTFQNYYGFKQNPISFGSANNAYGFYSNLSTGANTFNFYAASGAKNYFAGNIGISTTAPSAKLDVVGDIEVNSNVNLNSEAITLATTAKTQIASFTAASFRSGKLIVQAYDSVTGEVQVTELLVAHNGTTASATEYGVVYTGLNALATYDVDISAGIVRLLATRTTSNSTQYKTSETLMVA